MADNVFLNAYRERLMMLEQEEARRQQLDMFNQQLAQQQQQFESGRADRAREFDINQRNVEFNQGLATQNQALAARQVDLGEQAALINLFGQGAKPASMHDTGPVPGMPVGMQIPQFEEGYTNAAYGQHNLLIPGLDKIEQSKASAKQAQQQNTFTMVRDELIGAGVDPRDATTQAMQFAMGMNMQGEQGIEPNIVRAWKDVVNNPDDPQAKARLEGIMRIAGAFNLSRQPTAGMMPPAAAHNIQLKDLVGYHLTQALKGVDPSRVRGEFSMLIQNYIRQNEGQIPGEVVTELTNMARQSLESPQKESLIKQFIEGMEAERNKAGGVK